MNPSPLQLKRHFFTKIHLDAHREGDANSIPQVQAQVELARSEKDSRSYQVTLHLAVLPAGDKKPGYTAEIEVVGLVRVRQSWPEEKVHELVAANGPALLYGAAREMLCNLSARGPWPMLCLHSVTFVKPKPATVTTPKPQR